MPENNKFHLVIVGGATAGINAATRARRIDGNINITLIEESPNVGYSITGLPDFTFGILSNIYTISNNAEEKLQKIYNINVLKNTKAYDINKKDKIILCKNTSSGHETSINYDKLIVATGNRAVVPKSISKNAQNVFTLKNLDDAIKIRYYINKVSPNDIIIVGLNYYSLVLINSMLKKGFTATVIDESSNVDKFDKEFSYLIKNELQKSDITVYQNVSIKKYTYSNKTVLNEIKLSNDVVLKTNMIIFMNNYADNIEFLKNAGLETTSNHKIKVNEKMQTSDENIYAAGCIADSINLKTNLPEHTDSINGTIIQSRIAVSNALGIEEPYKGIIKNRIIFINDFCIGYTGINSEEALKHIPNSSSLTVYSSNSERFVSSSRQLHTKLIFNKENGDILGSQISGYNFGVDKRLDIFTTAIYSKLKINDIINLNFSYSPKITTYLDPVNILGMMASNIVKGFSNQINILDFDFSSDYYLLDIRTKNEYTKSHLEKSTWIPLLELRNKIDEIPKNKIILIYSHTGREGYIAERILKSFGFDNLYNVDGGITSIKLFENFN